MEFLIIIRNEMPVQSLALFVIGMIWLSCPQKVIVAIALITTQALKLLVSGKYFLTLYNKCEN